MSLQTTDAKYDVFRYILSLFVVAIHSNLFPLILYPWLRIAVPLFFCLSAFFFFSKMREAEPPKQKKILIKFVWRNLSLYCFWTLVLLPVTLVSKRAYFSNGIGHGFLTLFLRFLKGKGFGGSWFILALIMGTLIVHFLSKKLKNRSILPIALIAFFLVTLRSSYLFLFSADSALYSFYNIYEFVFENPALSFPASLIWIYIGKCFADKKIHFSSTKHKVFLIVVSCIALYLEWRFVKFFSGSYNNDSYFMLLPVCICVFSYIQELPSFSTKYSLFIRRASTINYVTHTSILHIIGFFSRNILHFDSSFPLYMSTLIICTIIYISLEYFISLLVNTPFIKFIKKAF